LAASDSVNDISGEGKTSSPIDQLREIRAVPGEIIENSPPFTGGYAIGACPGGTLDEARRLASISRCGTGDVLMAYLK
jgi:hypothetical protein